MINELYYNLNTNLLYILYKKRYFTFLGIHFLYYFPLFPNILKYITNSLYNLVMKVFYFSCKLNYGVINYY
jgi:hypothetical protein